MRRSASMFTVMLLLAGCSDGGAIRMPDVVGQRLDVAISDVKRAGFDDKVEIVGGGVFGIVDKSNWTACTQEPENGRKISAAPRFTVERTCEAEPTQKPDKSEPDTKAYDYQGPAYEVVSVDANQSAAKLKQCWVYTSALDYSTDAYRDEVKKLIADIVHTNGTNKFFLEVVADKEIAEAKSPSTYEKSIEEHGSEYAVKTIPQKEKTAWIASYTGGFDFDSGEASDSPAAYEIIWFPSAASETEKWRPETSICPSSMNDLLNPVAFDAPDQARQGASASDGEPWPASVTRPKERAQT